MEDNQLNFLREDEVHLFYEMMYQSLNTENVIKGMNKSLFLLKSALNTGNIILYRKTKDNGYVSYIGDSSVEIMPSSNVHMINEVANLVENKKNLDIVLDLMSEESNKIKLVHIKTDNNDYILSIDNYSSNYLNDKFIHNLTKTLEIILKRAEIYEHNVKAISTDLLTELDNRNSYEIKIQNLNLNTGVLVYGLFDLFRLKYVNDNYNHELGDIYIKETAGILSKYWPKFQTNTINGNVQSIETGHCVYRIGGDEFALITTNEKIELTKLKASLVAEEVKMLNLGIDDYLPLGLNYGIVEHCNGDCMKSTYIKADRVMAIHKEEMYSSYRLERRK